MDNNIEILIMNKIIQKALINELCNKDLINLINIGDVIKNLDKDISKLKKIQAKDENIKNLVVKILI